MQIDLVAIITTPYCQQFRLRKHSKISVKSLVIYIYPLCIWTYLLRIPYPLRDILVRGRSTKALSKFAIHLKLSYSDF